MEDYNIISKVNKAIAAAIEGESKLTSDILSMDGMSSTRNRHLLNNLADNSNYLEIGVWHGSTFISAIYKNNVNAYAIDNWSEFADGCGSDVFLNNCKAFGLSNFAFIEGDAFSIDLGLINHKINVYFYDGNHSWQSTAKALTYFYPVLEDEFIFIVDDFGWAGVPNGVLHGIKECNFKIIDLWDLELINGSDKDEWWNGLGIFILKKNE